MADIPSYVGKMNAFAAEVAAIGVVTPPPPPTGIAVGGRVKVINKPIPIRDIPNISVPPAVVIGQPQPMGAQGTVVAGPTADMAGNNGVFWQVDFDSGSDGWAWATNLAIATAPPGIPAPTITNLTATPSSLPIGGGSVVINATLTDTTSVTLDGAAVTLPVTVPLTVSHTFSLGATGPTPPPANAVVMVTVAAVPPPPPPPGGGVLANLASNTARNMGTYVNPDPDWSVKGQNITDDSGCFADPLRHQFALMGGGHGRSQETDIRLCNTLTGTWSSNEPSTRYADMRLANRDPVKGRWINTNQPCARHTYSGMVVRGDWVHVTTAYCQTDNTPDGIMPYVTGKICKYDLVNKVWVYSALGQAWQFTNAAILDPVSNMIYVFGWNTNWEGRIWKYDPDATPETLQTGPQFGWTGQPTEAVYCPQDDKVYVFHLDVTQKLKVWRVTLNRTNINLTTAVELTTTGPKPILQRPWGYPSFTWCDANNRIGGSFIGGVHYEFDPAASQWSARTVLVEAGSSGVPSNDFSCSAWMSDVGCYIFVQIAPTPRTWAYRP